HILIDIPVGPTAKVRDSAHARRLSTMFETVAEALGVMVRCVVTDGIQTIGSGIGPVEEARDVLMVLQNDPHAPPDLVTRSVYLASQLLSMASGKPQAECVDEAGQLLQSGRAWRQFQRICQAQGGLKTLPQAAFSTELHARDSGQLVATDNRRLAQLAKLAGAPNSPVSGLRLAAKLGETVATGQSLATLFAATRGELDYALDYYRENRDLFEIA
ncbi:MAG TPA: thymidine phosphorylase, partial [Cellvibrionaceae bacterium]